MTNSEIRLLAKEKCANHKGRLAVLVLIEGAIIALIQSIGTINSTKETMEIMGESFEITTQNPFFGSLSEILSFVVGTLFLLSFITIAKIVRSGEKPSYKALFSQLRLDNIHGLVIQFLVNLFTILWSLLLIVPGIIKSYSYSMALYIYHDNNNIDPMDAIKESQKLMDGHKWDLFCIDFYFGLLIGLSALLLFIPALFLVPRLYQTKYEFYLSLLPKEEVKEEPNDNFIF